ncbi:CDP-glycerol glycerophosphotransferase family protein [Ruicaihuangia caeni]|uniref:CDP-glycerol glycerophosphotransferase family protein n=1 Tax=Ruicaihuangia caeni TaxID=3042517 RepID=A0AAW6T5A7_9MICO|nr:CDP-glycerol glycerophosphotransferase family protein [Klugiella sp. YN-L-19]MDI2097558.1 CDP-glycerol glycerophosphotransferase family protein [Klugiella sp. YN-L-19]
MSTSDERGGASQERDNASDAPHVDRVDPTDLETNGEPTSGEPTGGMDAVIIDTVMLHGGEVPELVLGGTGSTPVDLELVGSRWRAPASVERDPQRDGWRATVALRNGRWSLGVEERHPLPPPAGRYTMRAASPLEFSASASLPAALLVEQVARLSFEPGGGMGDHQAPALLIAPPLADDERGPEQQRRLEQQYRRARPAPENAVFFESFYGSSASCNPRAIDRALSELAPGVTRYWSVADASVRVPEGAIRLIEGSREWWRVRASARLLVVNDWLRGRYRRRAHQAVLQTWHGTPLKRLALGRPGFRPRAAIATLRERSRWSIMLSQNPHSTRVFRRSYAFFGPVWELGYPRDDVLSRGEASTVRRRLGIRDDALVLLYAPTWRDDRPDEVDHLGSAEFVRRMPHVDDREVVVLLRGHSRTLGPGTDVEAPGVIDVTRFPDIAELYLAADALITDYSSAMFDFTVTGKPVLFFAPDLEHYRDRLRGFTFDLLEDPPGPVLADVESLARAVSSLDEVRQQFSEAYERWRQRFNPNDDGRAAERVVRRLLDTGRIG